MAISEVKESYGSVHISALTPQEKMLVFGPTQKEAFEALNKYEKFRSQNRNTGLLGKLYAWYDAYFHAPHRAHREVGNQIRIRRELRARYGTPTFRNQD